MPLKSKYRAGTTFTFDRTVLVFFGRGGSGCLHWDDCTGYFITCSDTFQLFRIVVYYFIQRHLDTVSV